MKDEKIVLLKSKKRSEKNAHIHMVKVPRILAKTVGN
jgi:hypothetical protein